MRSWWFSSLWIWWCLVYSYRCGVLAEKTLPTLRQSIECKCKEVSPSHLRASTTSSPTNSSCTIREVTVSNLTEAVLLHELQDSVEFQNFHVSSRKRYKTYFVILSIENMHPSLQPLEKMKSPTSSSTAYSSSSSSSPNSSFVREQRHVQSACATLDKFVTVRPWWIVRQYPTPHPPTIHPTAVASHHHPHHHHQLLLQPHHAFARPHHEIILERVPEYVEAFAVGAVALAFPAQCADRALYVKTSVGSWGNDIIVNMESYLQRSPEQVHLIYLTRSGSPHDITGHVETHIHPTCANQVDKHTCVFLAHTNCSTPPSLAACHDPSCIQEGYYALHDQHTEHRYVGNQDPARHRQSWDKYFPRTSFYRAQPSASWRMRHIQLGVVEGNIDRSGVRDDVNARMHSLYFMFNVIYRPNFHLGVHMQSVLEEFFDTPHVSPANESANAYKDDDVHNSGRVATQTAVDGIKHTLDRTERCHAAHIRMGDRYINRTLDMFDWCDRHTNHSERDRDKAVVGQWKDGQPLSVGQWFDMGCQCRSPFGTLTLQHYVNASVALNPDVKHLLVVTDDYHWLQEELKVYQQVGHYRQDITLHIFPTHINNVHLHRETMQATAEWWAAIQAARQCEGFIGHISSAASYSVYRAMCAQHQQEYLQCPPWFMFD